MPTFEITAPDGKKYRVTGDNAVGAAEALHSKLGGVSTESASSDVALQPGERPLSVFGEGVAPTDFATDIGKEVGKGVSYDFQMPPVSTAQAIGHGIAQGATGNLSDEASALAAASGLPGPMPLPIPADSIANAVPDPWTAISNVARVPIGAARLAAEKIAPSVFGSKATEAAQEDLNASQVQADAAMQQHPLATIGGNIAGGAVLAPAFAAAGPVLGGAGMGALYGLGGGTDPQSRLMGGAGGAVIGGGGGAVFGALPRYFTRPAPAATAGEVAAAAERQGIQIPIAAASNNFVPQTAGGLIKNIPFVGQPLKTAAQETLTQLDEKAKDIANTLGASSPAEAGAAAGGKIRDWIKEGSADVANRVYGRVTQALGANSGMIHPLTETRGAVADIMTRRTDSAMDPLGQAVNKVKVAITRPGGLNYEGLKDLRSYIGRAIKPHVRSSGDQAEYLKLYGALSDDLKTAAFRAGGQPALDKHNAATALYQQISTARRSLEKIVGAKSQAQDREIYENIKKLAMDKRSENVQRLLLARQTVGVNAWNGIAGDIVKTLGRDAGKDFSPNLFIRDYNKLSDAGKSVLFDSQTRRALDDIATISTRFKKLQQFANTSGTAPVAGMMAFPAWLMHEPVMAISAVIGGAAISKALSLPATASSMAGWSRAYTAFVAQPSAGTIASLRIASRNFGSTVADKLGIQGAGEKLFGSVLSRAHEQQQKQNDRPPGQKQESGR